MKSTCYFLLVDLTLELVSKNPQISLIKIISNEMATNLQGNQVLMLDGCNTCQYVIFPSRSLLWVHFIQEGHFRPTLRAFHLTSYHTCFDQSFTSLFCLLSVGRIDSQSPTQFFDYDLKWPTIMSSVKIQCGILGFAYQVEISRQGKYYRISEGATKFQPA